MSRRHKSNCFPYIVFTGLAAVLTAVFAISFLSHDRERAILPRATAQDTSADPMSSSVASSAASSSSAVCGNGTQEGSEDCDDGNTSNADACLNTCVHASCGDGYVRSGVEQCEPPSGAGCSAACKTEEGSGGGGGTGTSGDVIPPDKDPEGKRLTPPKHCGNQLIEPDRGEECDDGRANGVSGCSRWCKKFFCGDDIVSPQLQERCEPLRDTARNFYTTTCGKSCTVPVCTENEAGDEECSGGCSISLLSACKSSTPTVTATPSHKVRDAIQKHSAYSVLPVQESAASRSAPAVIVRIPLAESVASFGSLRPPPTPPVCGDDRIEAGEACDDGNTLSGDGCNSACDLEQEAQGKCGDGILQRWEDCDQGVRNSDEIPNACRSSCRRAHCGDAVRDGTEECDDGNTILGDGCTTNCMRSMCNNGMLELGEECDEGRLNSDVLADRCSTRCLMPRCGDGVVDPAFGETCDQGVNNDDKARDACRQDCTHHRCRDGTRDSSEQCDDGNSLEDDGCSNECLVPICGDGNVQGREICDDGNSVPGDGCSSWCTMDTPRTPPWWLVSMLLLLLLGLTMNWYMRRRVHLG